MAVYDNLGNKNVYHASQPSAVFGHHKLISFLLLKISKSDRRSKPDQ